MTTEELQPLWRWAQKRGEIWPAIYELWDIYSPQGVRLYEVWTSVRGVEAGFNAVLLALTPAQRKDVYQALLAKRLTS